MLQAYIDESVKDDIFVMAGYVAPAAKWAAFSEEWRALLDAPQPLSSFKMSRMTRSDGRMKRAEEFYRVIERHVSFAISCTIYVDQMVSASRSTNWPVNMDPKDRNENPFYFGFKAVIDKFAQEQHLLGVTEPVNFIFDNRRDKRPAIEGYSLIKSNSAPEFSKLMGDQPIFADDKEVLPLQSADLWAWWVRKWEEEGEQNWFDTKKLFDSHDPKTIPGISMQFGEDDFKIEFEKERKLMEELTAVLRRANIDLRIR